MASEAQRWLSTVITTTADDATSEASSDVGRLLIDPSTCRAIGWIDHAQAKDVDDAATRAEIAQAAWQQTWTGAQRRDALLSWADRIEAQKEGLAYLEALQGGKPLAEGRIDVDETVACFRYFAGTFAARQQQRPRKLSAGGA